MAYIDSKRPADRAASVGGVIAVHAALGYALIIGLQATGIIPAEDPPLLGGTVVEPLPLPPPPKPDPKIENKVETASPLYTPDTIIKLNPAPSDFEITDILPDPGGYVAPNAVPDIGPAGALILPPLPPALDPVSAKPRNDAARWITEADYKTSWINREMAGTAGFRLSIGANGQVEGCQITRSTGHSALDEATCSLVTRRAKFDPARGSDGSKVTGTYSSSVLWRIPE